ncbi:hypothetical protein BAUCODRAFT_62210 [Baudoinia panamericana UAMH 10762]|uniref:Sin3 binding protein n=1 Tax=Baudoinia panamericana (strain UAMH 10762) TaxID=717646 RepID=M2NQ61_BAUPA|nr:uncharacterized protein BAUCODRAFT_62210 [Baudoinia panamericana UAMH 10762]EMD01166.1 hypothetical protein BAUCODRAFT_62210 [Baudoinia panamericana UAMH 10762]
MHHLHDTAKVDLSTLEKVASALLTPPNSVSPELSAHGTHASDHTPPLMNIEQELDLGPVAEHTPKEEGAELEGPTGTPLSKGALSGLDATAAITPSMLAKHHLPGIMLGNGPRPIRYVMGELTHTVPGFSRIPPAKARRLVVAALEGRSGGGPDGTVAFHKTGWGRWDAHIKGSSRDSGIGSFHDGNFSPPRSERSYAMSYGDSGVHMHGPRLTSGFHEQPSNSSWSSIREEDELDADMDMDMPEHEADKMSLDDMSLDGDDSFNDDTEDDEIPVDTSRTPRKASLPIPGGPRKNYNAISAAYARRYSSSQSWSRRPSGVTSRSLHSTSMPTGNRMSIVSHATATPEEQAAAAALLSMGSM